MSALSEKGGGTFQGIKLLLCENPLPPIDHAIAAAQAEAAHGNYYTEPYSAPLRALIARLLDVAGQSVAHLVPEHPNLLVTRTLSKAHSLAGFRVGYGIFPEAIADDLNSRNDAYPLARPSQAAAIATLQQTGQRPGAWPGLYAHHHGIAREQPPLCRHVAGGIVMSGVNPFEAHHPRYEAWFDTNAAAYISELLALRPFVPWEGRGIEIGVGSGRFAAPLGIEVGIDPSPAMLAYAATRGIKAIEAAAENLPFTAGSFDYALVVTTICFVDSPANMLAETRRVLKPGGRLVIGFIDRESDLGQDYLAHQVESVFYRAATFYSAAEVGHLVRQAGFSIHAWGQTLALPLRETRQIESLRPGYGQCAFVVVVATKTS